MKVKSLITASTTNLKTSGYGTSNNKTPNVFSSKNSNSNTIECPYKENQRNISKGVFSKIYKNKETQYKEPKPKLATFVSKILLI